MNETLAKILETSLSNDLRAFLPELILCGGIVFMLLVRLVPRYDQLHLGWIALVIAGGVCYMGCEQWIAQIQGPDAARVIPNVNLFGGMLVFDSFAIFVKIFLYSFVTLIILLTLLTGIPDKEDSADL